MKYDFNAEIETLLSDFEVPVAYMFYEGNADTYITYAQLDKDASFSGDDKIQGFVIYYDIDIFSKTNYLSLINDIIAIFEGAGWTYQPNRESPDFYERDTKYFHKTIVFAKESEG